MLTKVRLDGAMGKKFGEEWNLQVATPAEALRLIEANKPGLRAWLIANAQTYNGYEVICTYVDGREEHLHDETFLLERDQLSEIRFVPVVIGASGVVKAVVGVIMVVAGVYFDQPWLVKLGATMILGGVIEALSPRPKTGTNGNDEGRSNSYYFDGPANTEIQGSPVPLIYGRLLVGSHPISASITVDEVAVNG